MTEKAPPKGRLFQEDLIGEPFWMLVACSLVNLTHWRQAEPVHAEIRRRWPTPKSLAHAEPGQLEEILRPLGLFRRRAASLRAMASAWMVDPPRTRRDVERLPGCGRYAADSWSIFVESADDVTVTDGKLLWYLRRQQERRQELQREVPDQPEE